MGAWGSEFSANDDAADWLDDFEAAPSWIAVEEALNVSEAYIEADVASRAIAAAEIVAAGLGNAHPDLDEALVEWVRANATGAAALKDRALATVGTILSDSELRDLWNEAEDPSWQVEVSNLQTRLN
jgi:hypothetical protein